MSKLSVAAHAAMALARIPGSIASDAVNSKHPPKEEPKAESRQVRRYNARRALKPSLVVGRGNKKPTLGREV